MNIYNIVCIFFCYPYLFIRKPETREEEMVLLKALAEFCIIVKTVE